MNDVTDSTNLKVLVEVEINHDGGKTSKEINVVCLPQ